MSLETKFDLKQGSEKTFNSELTRTEGNYVQSYWNCSLLQFDWIILKIPVPATMSGKSQKCFFRFFVSSDGTILNL